MYWYYFEQKGHRIKNMLKLINNRLNIIAVASIYAGAKWKKAA